MPNIAGTESTADVALIMIVILLACVIALLFIMYKQIERTKHIQERIAAHYGIALDRRDLNAPTDAQPPHAEVRARPAAEQPRGIDPRIIHLDFAQMNPPVVHEIFARQFDDGGGALAEVVRGMQAAAAGFGRFLHREEPATAKGPLGLVAAAEVPNDPENVHDHNIVRTRRDVVALLLNLNGRIEIAPQRLAQEILDKTSAGNRAKVMRVINSMSETIDGLDEIGYLAHVWHRRLAPENSARRCDIESAIINALLACMDGEHVVCSVGRTQNVLGALAGVDADERLWGGTTLPIIRAELFNEAAAKLNAIAEEYTEAAVDAHDKRAGEIYLGRAQLGAETDAMATRKFDAHMREKITEWFGARTHAMNIGDEDRAKILAQICAAID